MCGIVGYIGGREAGPFLVEGLKRLEYRGYDSAGAAYLQRADVGFRPLLRARHLSGRKAARLCVGPRRRRQPRYLGPPASQRSSGAGDHRQSGRP